MKDNQMNRGKTQALYKYLPGSWIDFSKRGNERKQYIAKVVRWNSEQLTNINRKRLLRKVNQQIQYFINAADASNGNQTGGKYIPPTSGFGAEISELTCDVLTPRAGGDERGIVAEISPLTFYCKKCYKVHQFRTVDDYRKHTKCKNCNIELTQFRQVYYCKCGWATDKHPAFCKTHGYKDIYWDGKYSFYCKNSQCARGNKIHMQVKCEVCGEMLYPGVALDNSQYFPFSFTLIDLIDEKTENFLASTDYGVYITIAYWIGLISQKEFVDILNKGIISDPEKYQEIYDSIYQQAIAYTDEQTAKKMAEGMAKKQSGANYLDVISDVKALLHTGSVSAARIAEMLLEYSMVKNSPYIITLEKAIDVAHMLNTNAEPEGYRQVAEKYGFSNVQLCDKIPFVACSYGYTRVETEYKQGVQLHAFVEEKPGRKNVYANCLDTEGVLFELDRVKIIKWLLNNGYISAENVPDLNSEKEVKMWFVDNIKPDIITSFSNIDENSSKETYYVYRLIHSISHALIKSAAELCGLDKNSISEYIFPGVPAILIFCQNSQGFNLGALNNVFEAYFDKWLNKAHEHASKCIFDPVCIERYNACAGCLYLNEVSCEHFNKDLDRRLLIGHYDREEEKRFLGFWEE